MKKRLTQDIPMDIKQYIPAWLLDRDREPAAVSVDIPGVNVAPEVPLAFHVNGGASETYPATPKKPASRNVKAAALATPGFDQEAFRLHLIAEGVSQVRARQTANRAVQAFLKAGVATFASAGKAASHPGLAEYTDQSRAQVVKAARRAYKWLEAQAGHVLEAA